MASAVAGVGWEARRLQSDHPPGQADRRIGRAPGFPSRLSNSQPSVTQMPIQGSDGRALEHCPLTAELNVNPLIRSRRPKIFVPERGSFQFVYIYISLELANGRMEAPTKRRPNCVRNERVARQLDDASRTMWGLVRDVAILPAHRCAECGTPAAQPSRSSRCRFDRTGTASQRRSDGTGNGGPDPVSVLCMDTEYDAAVPLQTESIGFHWSTGRLDGCF